MTSSKVTDSLKDSLEVSWLDSEIGEAGKHQAIKSYCQNISKLISKWNFFNSGDQLNNHMEIYPNVKLISIMSGRFARQILPLVSPRENLHSAYVFTIDIEKTKKALGVESKLKGIFNAEDKLFGQLRNDLSALFWDEGKRLVASNRDQEAAEYFAESQRLAKQID
ncbi:unnamed protein product [Rotaria socialis]|uniref:Uncharacterized protein n=1 Tax=Rotaria socialis TaxID=392032 RepID=A0A820KYJ6_9BILA|nr:unnamed protein product [Rotaria socialis]CAF3663953.1 unnamed protein product [Rotaria socialis]CAF4346657.1 unnamed protein product [Rotaria socialis]CAF4883999.1 unnamed protein product [Rotaria socialis]